MPFITESFDSLPYLDAEPSPQVRARITAQLASGVPPEAQTTLHLSIPELAQSSITPLLDAELERAAAKQPLTGIDTSRYEALDAPEEVDESVETKDKWNDSLRKAYTSQEYLRRRQMTLMALEHYGKNAWLQSNYHLEHILKRIEKELADAKETIESVNKERKVAQDNVAGEMEGLESTWRTGVGRTLEVEIANMHLRREILEAQRRAAATH